MGHGNKIQNQVGKHLKKLTWRERVKNRIMEQRGIIPSYFVDKVAANSNINNRKKMCIKLHTPWNSDWSMIFKLMCKFYCEKMFCVHQATMGSTVWLPLVTAKLLSSFPDLRIIRFGQSGPDDYIYGYIMLFEYTACIANVCMAYTPWQTLGGRTT